MRPAILWNDGRTAEETEYLNTVVGKDNALRAIPPTSPSPASPPPSSCGCASTSRRTSAASRRSCCPRTIINYMLTGVHCTDVLRRLAACCCLDVAHKCWSPGDAGPLRGARSPRCPGSLRAMRWWAPSSPTWPRPLGLPETVKVCAGAGDNAAAAVGTGTVGDGRVQHLPGHLRHHLHLQRALRRGPPQRAPRLRPRRRPLSPDGLHALRRLLQQVAGWRTSSAPRTTPPSKPPSPTTSWAGTTCSSCPTSWASALPTTITAARGTFMGLTMDASRADMTQAVLEGVAFGIRDSLEVARSLGLHIPRSKICGGGAKSPLWRKILANVLNLEHRRAGDRGGPRHAAAPCWRRWPAANTPRVEAAADALVHVTDTIHPDPEIAARYEAQYQKFRADLSHGEGSVPPAAGLR